ncbi:hypothetical protein LJR030_002872 [Rhizobium sp. LjRoot30]|uniref:hypothetical protein n=1 Tax=Rhizobium sp. LjRoot30 TaxID=3342320 RepID=UPI003ECD1E77
MATPTSTNIITFPKASIRPSRSETAALTTNAAAIALAVSAFTEGNDDQALHAASVVGASIRFARRKGISMSSLPKQLRIWLLQECDRGDPASLMVRDWLTGNTRFLGVSEPGGEGA